MLAGSGRLALGVSQKMMKAAKVSVSDAALFEIEYISAAPKTS